MKIIILAGGGGTRLFPLSRQDYPKQFLKIGGKQSLLVETVKRFLPVAKATDIVIVTNNNYLHHVKAELACCGAANAHVLLEPVARNTAPAIALAARYCQEILGASEDEVLFVSPADHIIHPIPQFSQAVRQAVELAQECRIVTFGIQPDKPETGYGYIQAGAPSGSGYNVAAFREKPDLVTAAEYVKAGNYYWNSGMFAFTLTCMLDELAAHEPSIHELASLPFAEIIARFDQMPNISIDYAVAERSQRVAMLPLTTYWNFPRDVFREAFSGGIIADGEVWLAMMKDRNLTSHTYDDIHAKEVYTRVKNSYIILDSESKPQKSRNCAALRLKSV